MEFEWTFSSRALILRTSSSTSNPEELKVWLPGSKPDEDITHALPRLQERPAWAQGVEHGSLGSYKILLRRINLPPSVFFCKGQEAISIFAADAVDFKGFKGNWIPVTQLKVNSQWNSVIKGICSQFSYALASGFLSALDNLGTASNKQRTSENPGNIGSDDHPRKSGSHPLQDEERGPNSYPSPPGCSGYDDEHQAWGVDPLQQEHVTTPGSPGSGSSEEDNNNLIDEPAVKEEALRWQSGQVAVIEEGGRDVQSVLDCEGVKLGIIDWHARWIEACLEIQPYMQRLAARFKSVAVMHVDVEHSMANKMLAYEKVLTRSESRRRGAKPVVRNGHKFPCLTVHDPSNPIPAKLFCGRDALDELAATALLARSNELTIPPQIGHQTALLPQAKVTGLELHQGKMKEEDVSPESHVPSGNLKTVKRGAMELKQHLQQAKQQGRRVVALWTSGTDGPDLSSLTAKHSSHLFLHADVTVGRDNRSLASSLRVKHYPTVQIYESLKLIKHIDQKAAVKEIVQTITEALTALDEAKASLVDQPQKTAEVEGSDDQALATNTDISEPSERKVQTKARASDMRNSLDSGDCFDTPRDTTKAEQKRVFSTGTGIFWPKMPCLRCGCPWWLGDDWDARCARCQWTAENDGYDDDSNPLPRYKANYREFTGKIRGGQTPEWLS